MLIQDVEYFSPPILNAETKQFLISEMQNKFELRLNLYVGSLNRVRTYKQIVEVN